jgi:hypothetical protein
VTGRCEKIGLEAWSNFGFEKSCVRMILSSDTMAQAAFGWQVDFNRAAKALSGKDKASGTGSVIFVKQPDGNWVVTGYGL